MGSHSIDIKAKIVTDLATIYKCIKLRERIFKHTFGIREKIAPSKVIEYSYNPIDDLCHHIAIMDGSKVVGYVNIIDERGAQKNQGFPIETWFNIDNIKKSGQTIAQVSRLCVDEKYQNDVRASMAMFKALGSFIIKNNVDILLGLASFRSKETQDIADALSYMHDKHLAPLELRAHAVRDIIPKEEYLCAQHNRKSVPSLIRHYTSMGGVIGDGFVRDNHINVIDALILVVIKHIPEYIKRRYIKV